jgi:glutathione peroxidase
MSETVYDFTAETIAGDEKELSDYQGKVLLVVNTASKCGFTPQFGGLEALYQKYRDDGLEVLGFPCNQFKSQDPGSDSEIAEFCQLNYDVTFPMFSKIEVNGDGAHPLYKYLKTEMPGILGSEGIKWNFTKFLIGKDGKPIQRFSPQTRPEALEQFVQAQIQI